MFGEIVNRTSSNLSKRSLISWRFGSHEQHNSIQGSNNKLEVNSGISKPGQETLIRKAGHEIGRVLEGGTDVLTAPAKWINHMQDNW